MPPRVIALVVSAALVLPITSACGSGRFACSEHVQCDREGGVCQPDGWCSFPDLDCPSGQRYGELAGGGLAGTCVPLDPFGGTDTTGVAEADADTGPALDSSDATGTTTTPIREATTSSSTGEDEDTSSSDSTGTPGDPSLVAWYTFDDPLDPYADASGNGLHASCVAGECPVLTDGVIGDAIRVAGIEHLHVEHAPELELNDAFTVAVWARVEAIPKINFVTIFGKPVGPAHSNSWEVGVSFSGSPYWYGGGGNEVEQEGVALPYEDASLDTWHHIALTWGEEVTLYFDGTAVGSEPSIELAYDAHPMMIGADIDDEMDDNFFHGSIDDARLYDRVLDEQEIVELASPR